MDLVTCGLGDLWTWGPVDLGTCGLGHMRTWGLRDIGCNDVKTHGCGTWGHGIWGLWDVINKQLLIFVCKIQLLVLLRKVLF